MPKPEPGICVECGKAQECLETSIGWMCRPCFKAALQNTERRGGQRIYTIPEPGRKVFVVKEPPNTFITVGGVLYAFDRKQDATDISEGLRKGYNIKAFVEEVPAMEPLQYVIAHPELRMIGVAEKTSDKDGGPNSIPMPRL